MYIYHVASLLFSGKRHVINMSYNFAETSNVKRTSVTIMQIFTDILFTLIRMKSHLHGH